MLEGVQEFSDEWLEAYGGKKIKSLYEVPHRFNEKFPVGFNAESVEHYGILTAGGERKGRESEVSSL